MDTLKAKSRMSRYLAFSVTLGLFAISFAVYAISPVTWSSDSRVSLHTAISLAHGRGGDLTNYMPVMPSYGTYVIEYPNGRPRNLYPIGPSLLAIPGVIVASWIQPDFAQRLREEGGTDGLEKTLASIIGAAAAVTFFWLIYERFQSMWIAGLSTFILAFCTSIWSSATRALWQQGPLVLMLVVAMLLLQRSRRRPGLVQYVGLPLAFAFLSRPTAAVPVVVISVYILVFYRPWFIRYLCWAALIAIPWIAYNISIYGGLFPTYYLDGLGKGQVSMWESLAANLVSPSRGLLVFSPVLIMSISGFLLAMREHEQQSLHVAYGLIVVLMLLSIANAPIWWAGHSYGPRFTTDLVPFLAFFTSFNFAEFGKVRYRVRMTAIGATIILVVASFLIHSQGAIRRETWTWNAVPNNIDENPSRVWDWRDPQFARFDRVKSAIAHLRCLRMSSSCN
jgi:hypothetical protein